MRSLSSALFGFALGCGVLLSSLGAFGQEDVAADALFRSAREAADRGDWKTACDRFAESHRLEPAPGTALNLGRCHEELGEIASAWMSYGEAAERLPPGDARADFARKKRADLESRLPRVTFVAPSAEADFTVTVRGVRLSAATFGLELPLDPGPARVVVEAEGRLDWTRDVVLVEGQNVEVQLELGTDAAGASVTSSAEKDPGAERESRILPWTLIAVGGVGAAAGAAGAVWSLVELGVVEDNCLEGYCTREGLDATERGKTAVILTAVGLGVGAIGLTTGIVLLSSKNGGGSAKDGRGSSGARHVGAASDADRGGFVRAPRVDFAPLPGGGYVSITGQLTHF